jgi:hypothetical protein
LFLRCEECYSAVESPDQSDNGHETFFAGDVKGEFADAAAIAAAGWLKYNLEVDQ